MSFEDRLSEFQFNWETLQLLQKENNSKKEMIELMSEINFSSDLTEFLLTNNNSFVNSVLLRLKLYNKLDKSLSDVLESFKAYNNLNHLSEHLLKKNTENLNDSNSVKDENLKLEENNLEENNLEENNLEEKVNLEEIDSNEDDSNQDDENHFHKFYLNFVKKTKNKSDVVKSGDVYSAYTEWYVNDYGEEVPSKKELKNFLNEKLGKSKKGSWSSVTLTL
jgi:hypothetical protein